jgi:hypothetical protein
MITPRMMIDFVSAEPFRPFRIHMASGRTFEIGHPEMIKVGRSSVTVYMRPESGPDQADRWQEVSLMLLESLEPLEAKTGTGSH